MGIQVYLAIFGAISPVLLLVLGAYLKRRLDQAAVNKTDAEAMVSEATAYKIGAEHDSVVLANAKQLIAEARTVQAEKDAIKDERINQLNVRVNRLDERLSRMRAALATHGVWDAAALIDLRQIKPEYPEPPPVPREGSYSDDD